MILRNSEEKTTTWQSGHHTMSITTARANGQSKEDWCASHDKAVDAAQAIYPPN